MAFLKIQTGERHGTVAAIQAANFTLGRGDDVELKVPDKGVSRRHAEVFRLGELHFIRDLDSRNGTFVNERQVKEAILRPGDRIRVGDSTLVFLDREGAPQSRVMSFHEEGITRDTIHARETLAGRLRETLTNPPEAGGAAAKEVARDRLARRVAETIAGGEELHVVLEKVVAQVGRALGADRADILLVEREPGAGGGGARSFRSAATFDTKGDGEMVVSRTILNRTAETGEAVLSSDAASDERFDQARSVAFGALRSVICVPLLAGGEAAALLYVCNSHHAQALDARDLEVAVEVGLQLGNQLGLLLRAQAWGATLRQALVAAVRSGAPGGAEHAGRSLAVARYAGGIALALGLSPEEVNALWAAGMLHGLPAPPGVVEKGEGGAGGGAAVVAGLTGLDPVAEALRHMDERQETLPVGSQRTAKLVPIRGRVLALARELERLTREGGPGGGALGLEEALHVLRDRAGHELDADLVRACHLAHRAGALAAGAPPGLLCLPLG